MGKKSSDSNPQKPNSTSARTPVTFVVASDRIYLDSVLDQLSSAPDTFEHFENIKALTASLDKSKISLAFVVVVERSCDPVDPIELRACKLEYPQVNYLLLIGKCNPTNMLRYQSIGMQNILLPPYDDVDLVGEIASALPNIPQFTRNSDLMRRGFARLDFSIPSDLQYILGLNYVISLMLKEFAFPTTDTRINIPLACDEAITNAILHGNGGDAAKKVSIQMYVSASRFRIRVKDQGEGFDVEKVADPTKGEALMRASGRGVYLMNTIMDSVEFKDGGTVVELEKTNARSRNGATNDGS